MKNLTKITAAAILAFAAAAPALAKTSKPVHHTRAMAQAPSQQDEADRGRAYAPQSEWDYYAQQPSSADY